MKTDIGAVLSSKVVAEQLFYIHGKYPRDTGKFNSFILLEYAIVEDMDPSVWGEEESFAIENPVYGKGYAWTNSTLKVPPAFDGHVSWFVYEKAVQDWLDLTDLDRERRGPALRARLQGSALIYKDLFERERLRDPERGVSYFLDTLRPHFLKGATHIFLARLTDFFKMRRGHQDFATWSMRVYTARDKLRSAWMDMLDRGQEGEPFLQFARQRANNPQLVLDIVPLDELHALQQAWQEERERAHANAFPSMVTSLRCCSSSRVTLVNPCVSASIST